MNSIIYTTADLHITPYQFESIQTLHLVKQVGEHAKLVLSGIVSQEKLDQYVEQADEEETIELYIQDGDRRVALFRGSVTSLRIQAVRDVRRLVVEAHSSTFLMDVQKKTRSFQNTEITYSELFEQITAIYPSSDVVDAASGGRKIGSMLVQYQETDWAFIRRMASHFHAPLVPVCSQAGLKFYAGVPDIAEPQKLEAYNYTMNKDLNEYKVKSLNGMSDLSEQHSVSYEVQSHRLLELCSPVQFQQRTLYVNRAETSVDNGIIVHHYVLCDREGMGCRTEYAYDLAGVSLFGTILEVARDQVKVRLHIDGGTSAGACWLPYSTVYSSPDGSGWYCMPEIGDEVRVYFPDEQEKHAFAASAVNLESSDPEKRGNPDVKRISTKYGKQIVFQPGAIEIIGGGKLLMRLTDEGGIEMYSDKKIAISAMEDIEIQGGAKIVIQGDAGVDLKQADTALLIQEQVSISGAKVNIE